MAMPVGISHWCGLVLVNNGNRLDGEDIFLPARGDAFAKNMADAIAVRFHLHASVRANRLSDGHGVLVALPNKEVWIFCAPKYGPSMRRLIRSRLRKACISPDATFRSAPRRSQFIRLCGNWRFYNFDETSRSLFTLRVMFRLRNDLKDCV